MRSNACELSNQHCEGSPNWSTCAPLPTQVEQPVPRAPVRSQAGPSVVRANWSCSESALHQVTAGSCVSSSSKLAGRRGRGELERHRARERGRRGLVHGRPARVIRGGLERHRAAGLGDPPPVLRRVVREVVHRRRAAVDDLRAEHAAGLADREVVRRVDHERERRDAVGLRGEHLRDLDLGGRAGQVDVRLRAVADRGRVGRREHEMSAGLVVGVDRAERAPHRVRHAVVERVVDRGRCGAVRGRRDGGVGRAGIAGRAGAGIVGRCRAGVRTAAGPGRRRELAGDERQRERCHERVCVHAGHESPSRVRRA